MPFLKRLALILALLVSGLAGLRSPLAAAPEGEEARAIHALLASESAAARFASPREAALNWKATARFYAGRDDAPAWSDGRGGWTLGQELAQSLEEAGSLGLDPGDYPVKEVRALLESAPRSGAAGAARLDVYLSYLYLTYARHLSRGRLDPVEMDDDWHLRPTGPDLVEVLSGAVKKGKIADSLHTLNPSQEAFERLLQALRRYRELEGAGGRPRPEGKFRVELGDSSDAAAEVRRFLDAAGDLRHAAASSRDDVFGSDLDTAVRRYQSRHGLLEDGIVGARTLAEMKTPVRDRVATLLVNAERWRWLPESLGGRYVMVNVPAYELRCVEDNVTRLTMRVVTGSEFKPTPAFSGTITYMDVNPRWYVPESIAGEEILPKLKESGPSYLTERDITVLGPGNKKVDPATVDWSRVEPDSLPYHFRQEPGPKNPLGTIKFMFPNEFSVYLHDTSEPHLFDRSRRGYSHGCVRIEKPLEFAGFLLEGDSTWTVPKVRAAIRSKAHRIITLPQKVPVYLLYWTAFVEPDGTVNFRRDVYGHDATIAAALRAYRPPYLRPADFMARLGPG